MLPNIDTTNFIGRKEKLLAIKRYGGFLKMLYRTNLWTHTHRMSWMVEDVGSAVQKIYPHFDIELARTMAFVHDDIEIIIGDIMFGAKLNMSDTEITALHQEELAAVRNLATTYPKTINGFPYEALMNRYETLAPDDIEAHVVKYIDKFDAIGESAHELFAGNTLFIHGYSPETLAPLDSLMTFFDHVYTTHPTLKPLKSLHPLFGSVPLPDTADIAANGKLHTKETLSKHTTYTPYNTWKKITLSYGGTFGKQMLLDKKE
jgi:5'-deoxynucleotidase YfbR-like HD superfamily hydrolase